MRGAPSMLARLGLLCSDSRAPHWRLTPPGLRCWLTSCLGLELRATGSAGSGCSQLKAFDSYEMALDLEFDSICPPCPQELPWRQTSHSPPSDDLSRMKSKSQIQKRAKLRPTRLREAVLADTLYVFYVLRTKKSQAKTPSSVSLHMRIA